jgi:hypothetical protein
MRLRPRDRSRSRFFSSYAALALSSELFAQTVIGQEPPDKTAVEWLEEFSKGEDEPS